MANTKKVHKVNRRTNVEIQQQAARERAEDTAQAARMSAFITRNVVDPIASLWRRIRERDQSYQSRTIVESDDFVNAEAESDSDDDELDFEDCGGGGDDDDGDDDDDSLGSNDEESVADIDDKMSVMNIFMKSVRKQIQNESITQKEKKLPEKEKWIFKYLSDNGFWIRKECVQFITAKLNTAKDREVHHVMDLDAYYCDIRVSLLMKKELLFSHLQRQVMS